MIRPEQAVVGMRLRRITRPNPSKTVKPGDIRTIEKVEHRESSTGATKNIIMYFSEEKGRGYWFPSTAEYWEIVKLPFHNNTINPRTGRRVSDY